ncbi:unnamed protein product, partial [Allacma fusca]
VRKGAQDFLIEY